MVAVGKNIKTIRVHKGLLQRDVYVEALDKIANEKVHLISQLEDEDKQAVYSIIDGMLTKNKFQIFFNKIFK